MTANQITRLLQEILKLYPEEEVSDETFERIIKNMPLYLSELNYMLSMSDDFYFETGDDFIYIESKEKLQIVEEFTNLEKGYIQLKKVENKWNLRWN